MIYDINNKSITRTDNVLGTEVYYIDDFYANPHLVLERINSEPLQQWKPHLNPNGYNGNMFFDGRHLFKDDGFKQVTDFLSTITKQEVEGPREIFTNVFQMAPSPFNDYENNFWMPHLDEGYNAIIYLNDIPPHSGTNIYAQHNDPEAFEQQEHEEPWRPKSKWDHIYTVVAKFNRCVMFDGKKLFHGMAIDDDTFMNTTRLNQVIFFNDPLYVKNRN